MYSSAICFSINMSEHQTDLIHHDPSPLDATYMLYLSFSLRKRHFISASRGPTSWRAHHKVLSIAKLVFVLLDRCTWRTYPTDPLDMWRNNPSPQKGVKKGDTLQGINILNITPWEKENHRLKMPFWGDMLVSWRVSII